MLHSHAIVAFPESRFDSHRSSRLKIYFTMANGFGSKLVASTERKFGHLAIPGLLRWVGGFQLLIFIISAIDPNYISLIEFDRDAIFSGQVWRLFSYLFLPRTDSMLWILFSILFLWFINNGLETAWGSFRVNLYLYSILFCLTSIGLLVPWANGAGIFLSVLVYSNLFFAFATIYPNQEILLMLIIPIKIKYLAWVNAAYLLLISLSSPLMGILVLLGLVPFLLVFGPAFIRNFKERGIAASRKAKYQSEMSAPEGQAFHTCSSCEVNDITSPDLEFRVAENGDEYCIPCLEKIQQDGPPDSTSDWAAKQHHQD